MLTGTTARTPVAFLQALHAGCTGVTELRAMRSSNGSRPDCTFLLHDDLDGLSHFTAQHKHDHVYVAVATRRDHTSGRLDNCAQLPALFIDIDFKSTAEADARRRLAEFPLPPSAVVLSGGGLHVYWLFHEPMNLQSSEERTLAYTLLRRLAQYFAADAQAAEPARVLRMPGTFNVKYEPPRFVQLEHLAEELRYHPCEFDGLLPAEPIMGNNPSFVAPEKIGDGERNGTLFKEARSLKAKNFSREAIRGALHAENRAKCQPPLPDAEIEAIVESAWSQADRPEFTSRHVATETTRTVEDLELDETAGLYTVRSAKHGVTILFDRLTDKRDSLAAEVTVILGTTELLSGVDVGLKSDTGQSKLAGSLKVVADSVPWKLLLQKSCALVLRRHRRGEPPAHLNKHSTVEPLTYAINPLVPRKKSIIIFADGGKGKSTFALKLGMAVSTGQSIAGFSVLQGKALFLDWEDDLDVHTRRLHALRAGHPELDQADVAYQRCCEPLTKLTYDLARTIRAEGITFVIIDSLLAAMGGEASAEAVGKFFAAVRLFHVESLLIGHTPKTPAEGQEHATVYGSVFNQNFARGVWELKKEQDVDSDTSILGLFNRKSNLSRLHPPIGLKVTHNRDGSYIRYDPYDLSQAPELSTALPLPNRIRNLLEDGTPREAKEIAEELGVPLIKVQPTLSKKKGEKWQMLGGQGQRTTWTTLRV